jgi:dienelactone hydrolase
MHRRIQNAKRVSNCGYYAYVPESFFDPKTGTFCLFVCFITIDIGKETKMNFQAAQQENTNTPSHLLS